MRPYPRDLRCSITGEVEKMTTKLLYLPPVVLLFAACQPQGTVDYMVSENFAAASKLSQDQQVLVTLVPARDSDEARKDTMFYCEGLRDWQDATPGPTSPHRCVVR